MLSISYIKTYYNFGYLAFHPLLCHVSPPMWWMHGSSRAPTTPYPGPYKG